MSASFVVDASVGFSWVHQNQATAETDKLLGELALGATAVVPSLWFMEMANILLIAQRRHRLTADQRKKALVLLDGLNLLLDDEGHRSAFRQTSELAEKHGLSI